MNYRSFVAGMALMLVLVLGAGLTKAQDTTPTAAETVEVTIGGYAFDYQTTEPFLALPISRTTSSDGAFVTWFAAAELPSGAVTGLTPCDDLAVICAPIISPAKAGMARADSGDSIPLAGDGQ